MRRSVRYRQLPLFRRRLRQSGLDVAFWRKLGERKVETAVELPVDDRTHQRVYDCPTAAPLPKLFPMNRSAMLPSRLEMVRRIAFYASERSEYASRVMEGVLRYAEDHIGFLIRDFQDDLTLTPHERSLLTERPPPWADWQPDGLLAILPHNPAVVDWLRGGGIPVVSLGGDYHNLLPTVHIDPVSIAGLAVEHFLESGYEHFAFVGIQGIVAVEGRCRSFRARLKELSQPVLWYQMQTNPWPGLYELEEKAASEPGLLEFLRSAPKPLAVLATSDYVGRVICMACRQLGFQVPQEVGVLGVDNSVASRRSFGGTAPERVLEAVAAAVARYIAP